jgi:hypothetical protein
MPGLITQDNLPPLADFRNFLGQNIDNPVLSLGLGTADLHLVAFFYRHPLLNPITLRPKTNDHPDSTAFNLQLEIIAICTGLNGEYPTRYSGYSIDIVTGFKIQRETITLLSSPEGLHGKRKGHKKDQQRREDE